MLRAVQIPDPARRQNAYPHELSGGMAQRVVIAIALICSPRFIISDDATSGLDVTVQAQVLELLKGLVQERQSAMLFITRDVGIAAHYCDRVAVIYRGQLMEVAAREDFFFNPMHPYSVMLLAAFSYNPRLRQQWVSREEVDCPGDCHPAAGLLLRRSLRLAPGALFRRGAGNARDQSRALGSLPLPGEPMTNTLEVDNIYKTFPVAGSRALVRAVNGVSFTVGQGETVALVGESGSGKTTVGRCIVGLAEVGSGSIRFYGEDITKGRRDRAMHGKIQLVFQEPAESLDPRYRIGRSILEPLEVQRVAAPERRRRLIEVIELVGLSDRRCSTSTPPS